MPTKDATELRREDSIQRALGLSKGATRDALQKALDARRRFEAEAAADNSDIESLARRYDLDGVTALVPRRSALLVVIAAARRIEDDAVAAVYADEDSRRRDERRSDSEQHEYKRRRAGAISHVRSLDADLRALPQGLTEREREQNARTKLEIETERDALIAEFNLLPEEIHSFDELRSLGLSVPTRARR